jgi:adenine-specific DNA-methyltransferase
MPFLLLVLTFRRGLADIETDDIAAMSGHIDKSELISKLQTLEGLTNDERSNLIGLLRQHKKYGLVWEEREEAVEERLREELPVLVEDKDLALLDGGKETPNHILIEGDNLEALTTLSYTHEGKVDVIYIDPPYNTGNKDFVYNDSFVDSEDSYRHSKWLSFMSKRLRIAKRLLSDRGVIFISIDDNEQANLKLLCDEVFGERNFVTNFVWQSTAGSNTGTDIITVTEYVMLYCKNCDSVVFDGQETSEENFPYSDEYEKNRGKYALDKMDRRRVGGHYSEALNFPIECPDGTMRWPGGGSERSSEGWNYLWSTTKVQWGKENGFIVFKKGKDGWNVYNKRYSRIDNTGNAIDRTTPFRNLITSDLFNTAQGTAEITSIFGVRMFDFPKPSNLIKYLLTTIVRTHKSSTILDFFAGSGTTLHAVMQLNKEDGGKRQCILVTNNENNICREVTYERNKRVIEGYTTPKGVAVEGLKANTLRYYKTDFIPRERTQKNMRALVAAATDLLCIKEDLYEEQKTFGRFKLKPQLARYFNDGKKHMLIIYREELVDEIAEEIKNLDFGKMRLKIYVFSPGRYAFADNFYEVEDKVELVALPAAIYDAYQKVLPKRREKQFEEEKPETIFPKDLFAGQEEGGEA